MTSIFSRSVANTAAIAAAAYWRTVITESDQNINLFFNFLVLHNKSDQELKLMYDGRTDDYDLIPANSIVIKTGFKFRSLVIYNNGLGQVDISDLELRYEKQSETMAVFEK